MVLIKLMRLVLKQSQMSIDDLLQEVQQWKNDVEEWKEMKTRDDQWRLERERRKKEDECWKRGYEQWKKEDEQWRNRYEQWKRENEQWKISQISVASSSYTRLYDTAHDVQSRMIDGSVDG